MVTPTSQTAVYPPQPLANGLPSTTGVFDVTPSQYVPYSFVGATDPLIKFDDTQGKFGISQLHTPLKSGNGTFQIPSIPQSTEPNITQAAAHFKKSMQKAPKVSERKLEGIGPILVGIYTGSMAVSVLT